MKLATQRFGGMTAVVVMIGLWGGLSHAYTPILTTNENIVYWELDERLRDLPNIIEGSVEFFTNRIGTPDIEDNGDGTGGEFDILRHAFRAWEKIPSSNIDFNDLKLTDQSVALDTDSTNVILFDSNNFSGLFPEGTGVIAFTILTFDDEEFDGQLDGHLVDADLVFNDRDFDFGANIDGKFIRKPGTSDPSKGLPNGIPMDLLSVAVHEVGHICGLDHSFHQNVVDAPVSLRVPTMYPLFVSGDAQQSTLEQDDIAGATELYPNEEFNRKYNGSISGRVTRPNPDPSKGPIPLFGVDVIAYHDGAPVASAITRGDGVYRIQGVPSGEYILRTQVISPTNTGLIQPVELNFQSEYYPAAGLTSDASPITVIAGKRRFDLNFSVKSDTAPDIFEPNDAPGQASDLAVDGPRMIHQFYREGDEDWVRFMAVAGRRYRLTTDNLSVFADPLMQLYASDGQSLLAENDDIDVNIGNLAARIEFTAAGAGAHFVKLVDVDDLFGFGTSFEFFIEDLGVDSEFDANKDGRIDGADLFAYAAHWGSSMKGERIGTIEVDGNWMIGMLHGLRSAD